MVYKTCRVCNEVMAGNEKGKSINVKVGFESVCGNCQDSVVAVCTYCGCEADGCSLFNQKDHCEFCASGSMKNGDMNVLIHLSACSKSCQDGIHDEAGDRGIKIVSKP